jgi:hypothetical protein
MKQPGVTTDVIDALILAEAGERWLKVARIVGRVSDQMGGEQNLDAVAARIHALVNGGKLQAKGDVSKWLHSEVRLSQV